MASHATVFFQDKIISICRVRKDVDCCTLQVWIALTLVFPENLKE